MGDRDWALEMRQNGRLFQFTARGRRWPRASDVLVARELGWDTVPCLRADHMSLDEKRLTSTPAGTRTSKS